MSLLRTLTLILPLLLVPVLTSAGIYKCTDEQGRELYKDTPCKQNERLNQEYDLPNAGGTGPLIVPLTGRAKGQYWVDTLVNDTIPVKFLIDTGANLVKIPQDLFDRMLAQGTAGDAKVIGEGTATVADGYKYAIKIYNIRSLTIGGRKIHNIRAGVGKANTTPLLGTPALNKLGKWRIDQEMYRFIVE